MSDSKKYIQNPFAKSKKSKLNENLDEDQQTLLKDKNLSDSNSPNDFIKSQMNKAGISEDTIKFGLNFGKQMVKDSKFIDYFSLTALKPYFEIDNQYVINKLKTLSIPFIYYFRKNKNSFDSDDMSNNQIGSNDFDNAKKLTIEYPDLYIPIMSFLTYILLIGFYSASLSEQLFDPQILGRIASKNFFLILLQVFVCKLLLFIFSSSKISFIDNMCYLGYKFIYMVFVALTWIFLGNYKVIIYIFLGIACIFSVLFLNLIYSKRLSEDGKMKGMIIPIFSAVEVVMILLIILDIHLYCSPKSAGK